MTTAEQDNNSVEQEKAALPVAVDAMGGDFGPDPVVQGAVQAAQEFGISSILVGDEAAIRKKLTELRADKDARIGVLAATEVVTMEDSPSQAIRGKPDSSIRRAFELVKAGTASSVVSPGNTGAVMATGLFISGTLPGIIRPAIASLIPNVSGDKPTVLLDSGANVDCHAHQLVQFALMGHHYAKCALGINSPRVALLSNGTESGKGTDILRSAALTLSEIGGMNFVGYVEGYDIPRRSADVIVCDGFVGNVVLKTMEGTVELVVDAIKRFVGQGLRGRIGMWIVRPLFRTLFREKLDASAYGGAPLLGLNDITIICHGSSKPRAIANGIRVAHQMSNDQIIGHIKSALSDFVSTEPGNLNDGVWNRMGQRFEKGKAGSKQRESEKKGIQRREG